MSEQTIDYTKLVEQALRHVVRDTLTLVAERGLPGRHNIYITFSTEFPGVVLADELRARYPGEMTIVLQHEFWGLEVTRDGFGVTLSFNNQSQRIEIPFEAITVFADPSVEFGLQFNLTGQGDQKEDGEETGAEESEGDVTTMPPPSISNEAAVGEAKDGGSAEVVTLDQFRKKS